jgi:predicted adenine nucleotide alpha hydrolase (AANH) superfamily ATPase
MGMRILLHLCCANCAIYPYETLRERGIEVIGYFFNPNIHPYQEYERRRNAVSEYSKKAGLSVIYRDEYLLEEFLRNVVNREKERCGYCYHLRLEATALEAKRGRFDAFSTTLLQSHHQHHQTIREIAEQISREVGIPFHYEDFRSGWRRGVEVSKAMGLYRQQYCGCIYSEKERFLRKG